MVWRQRLDVFRFSAARLRDQLKLPVILDGSPSMNQLTYLASYAGSLGCRSILIERHYIDRDYIEDHGLFYSRSLYPYPNHCQRVHFFKTTAVGTQRRFSTVARSAIGGPKRFARACAAFSDDAYLGFVVIKPLAGSPVGRTILRPYPRRTDDRRERHFTCIRRYGVHVNGIELSIDGLPFQEQDVGVSACATTAIWCSLQKIQESENLPSATPAQISTLASRFTLPFGRVFPADEGLNVDQMCQAIQAIGAAPNLLKAAGVATTRSYLYSALRSQMPAILILEHEQNELSHHAITTVGMRLLKHRTPEHADGIDDRSIDLEAVYVHDDRTGPYLRANLVPRADGTLKLDLLRRRNPEVVDPWIITHLLVPMHQKVRLSFSTLRRLSGDLVGYIHVVCKRVIARYDLNSNPVTYESWISRAHTYMSHLYFEDRIAGSAAVRTLAEDVIFPRYVGVVRLTCEQLGTIDVVFDTTSTSRNLHCVVVVVHTRREPAITVGNVIAQLYDARLAA